jgi:secreted trypsin-like serine protease
MLGIALVAVLTASSVPASAIIGGIESTHPLPFTGSLNRPSDSPRPDGHVCGVTLIAPQWVVTAAHCARNDLEAQVGYPHDWTVRLGSTRTTSGGELFTVDKYVRRSSGRLPEIFGKDLALLKLSRPAKATPVPLVTAAPQPGTRARILGWGKTCDEGDPRCFPDKLREADTPVQSTSTCQVSGSDLCIGALDGTVTPADMDSGGPALVRQGGRWALAGVVSGGGAPAPGIYTNVAAFRTWIDQTTTARNPTLDGAVSIDTCSGSVVRKAGARHGDRALLLTNGHCVDGDRPAVGSAVVNRPEQREVIILGPVGQVRASARTTTLLYATMTGTDLALYQLDRTYQQLEASGVRIFELSTRPLREAEPLDLIAGSRGKTWSCAVADVVPELREGGYTFHDSIRYTEDCTPHDGDSGSPMVDPATGQQIGIHNTSNGLGGVCTAGNPCEFDPEYDEVTVHPGRRYGQQTAAVPGCLTPTSTLDLTQPNCTLTKPKR